MTNDVFLEVLEILLDKLEDYVDFFRFILVFDAVRCHLSVDVANKMAFAGIKIVIVPAKLTWLLQPLDTHVFAQFKNNLKKKLQRAALSSESGLLKDQEWIQSMAACITELSDMDHRHAFDRNGMMGEQGNMKAVEDKVLSETFVAGVGRQPPSEDDVKFALNLTSVPWYQQVVGFLQDELALESQGGYAVVPRPHIEITGFQ